MCVVFAVCFAAASVAAASTIYDASGGCPTGFESGAGSGSGPECFGRCLKPQTVQCMSHYSDPGL